MRSFLPTVIMISKLLHRITKSTRERRNNSLIAAPASATKPYFNRSLKSRSFALSVSFAPLPPCELRSQPSLPRLLLKREGSYFINLSAMFKSWALAVSFAMSYPASACLITPMPGSFLKTLFKRCSASSVPSATMTIPAWML